MGQVTRGTALLALAAALFVFSACSNVETPNLDEDVKNEKIIPPGWQPLPLRVGLAPFRAALELDEKRYNVDDTQRWVLTPDDARLNGGGGLHNQLVETFRKYRMFERVEQIEGATPDTSREDLQALALKQGLDVVIVPTLKRQDVGYVDSNGLYGWNMFIWWMVSPIFSWWIADEDFDVNLHVDLRMYPTTRDIELGSRRLQPPETVVRSLDDWDEGWNLFGIFSTPGRFDEENWTRIGDLLMPIAENEAKKAALKYVTGDLAKEAATEEFREGIRRRVALVVGVDGTGQPPLPLSRYAEQDAQAMAAQLLDAQNEAVPEGAMRTITGARATRRAVLSAAESLSALARYNDDVYLVFAGVGGLDANLRPTLVLAQPAGTKQLEQVGVSEVLDALLKNNPRTLTLVLDTSFVAPGDKRCAANDAQLATMTEKGMSASLLDPIIKQVEARGTKCIILSATDAKLTEDHMQALEIEDLNHGLFSSFALEALAGGADANRDRLVTYDEFQKYVGEKVSYIAGLEGKSQTGWFYASPDRKTFALPSWRQ
ncbi:MAG: hypothetical protein KDB90_14965 [Planctomycetes bacterium]|nr:hypothetical protein [Planctomycetota bacterium]